MAINENDDYNNLDNGVDGGISDDIDTSTYKGGEKADERAVKKQQNDSQSFIQSLEAKAEKIASDSEPRKRWNKNPNEGKPNPKEQSKKFEQKPTDTKQNNNTQKPAEKKTDDLVDENGNLIAKAGAERRVYEEAKKIKEDWNKFNSTVLPQIKQQYDEAMNIVKNLQSLDSLVKVNNLTHEELNTIAQVAVEFKKNPVGALKMMLTNAVKQGYDVSEIINAGQSQSIESILSKKLEPLQQFLAKSQQQEQEEVIQQQIAQEVAEFQNTFPFSKIHSKEIVEVTRQMGLEENIANYTKAYWKLRSFYEQKGYDFSKLWSESAKNASDDEDMKSVKQYTNNIRKPEVGGGMPPISRNSMNYNGNNMRSNLSVNSSYADIIESVMAEDLKG